MQYLPLAMVVFLSLLLDPFLTPGASMWLFRVVVLVGLAYLLIVVHWRLPRAVAAGCTAQQQRVIEALATAVNAKDKITFQHVRRVQIYAEGMGKLMSCTGDEIMALRKAALLHDVGKIGVSDLVLCKPGKLTEAEFAEMKMHPIIGAQILERVQFPFPIVPIVRGHHERWDGTGYPDGLANTAIPLCARILSIVDCFDAVREDRQYRKGLTREEAIKLVLRESGKMYDPDLVGIFITNLPRFEAQIQADRNSYTYSVEQQPRQLSVSAQATKPAAGLAGE